MQMPYSVLECWQLCKHNCVSCVMMYYCKYSHLHLQPRSVMQLRGRSQWKGFKLREVSPSSLQTYVRATKMILLSGFFSQYVSPR